MRSSCNCGFKIAKTKVCDAYLPDVVVSFVRVDMERAESRLRMLVEEKLEDTVVHEVHRILFFVHLDQVRTPGSDSVDAVDVPFRTREWLADFDAHGLA